MLTADSSLFLWFERSKMPAWGVCGGMDAIGPKIDIFNEKGELVDSFLKVANYPMGNDWTVEIHTGGGGGYGDPLKRDPQKVQRDVQYGYISRERAKEIYEIGRAHV